MDGSECGFGRQLGCRSLILALPLSIWVASETPLNFSVPQFPFLKVKVWQHIPETFVRD